jgi:hypothetical protein
VIEILVPPKILEPLGPDPPSGGGGGTYDPPERTWEGVGTKPMTTLYPGGTKSPEILDGTWVEVGNESIQSSIPRGK